MEGRRQYIPANQRLGGKNSPLFTGEKHHDLQDLMILLIIGIVVNIIFFNRLYPYSIVSIGVLGFCSALAFLGGRLVDYLHRVHPNRVKSRTLKSGDESLLQTALGLGYLLTMICYFLSFAPSGLKMHIFSSARLWL